MFDVTKKPIITNKTTLFAFSKRNTKECFTTEDEKTIGEKKIKNKTVFTIGNNTKKIGHLTFPPLTELNIEAAT